MHTLLRTKKILGLYLGIFPYPDMHIEPYGKSSMGLGEFYGD